MSSPSATKADQLAEVKLKSSVKCFGGGVGLAARVGVRVDISEVVGVTNLYIDVDVPGVSKWESGFGTHPLNNHTSEATTNSDFKMSQY